MLRALYVDMNSFFASCEQQLDPSLRGRAVAVVPMMADTTFVLAASYEAKAFGVKTGTRVGDAKRMCPGLVLVKAGHGEYVKFHHKVHAAIDTVIPIHATRSIDEFACLLTGTQQDRAKAERLAMAIKVALKEQVGESIRASIGIAPNFLLAKIAADLKKPDGLTVLEQHSLREKLRPLKLQDVPGIGPRMEVRLHAKGITTMDQLLALSEQHVRGIWESVWGARMQKLLNGEWIDFLETSETKSIGHEHVLPPLERTYAGGLLVAQKLLWKAAVRMRAQQFMARKLSLSVRYMDGDKAEVNVAFSPSQDSGLLLQHINVLYNRLSKSKKPRKIAIVLFDFVSEHEHQLSFFEKRNRSSIYKAVDTLNQKFGRNTVIAGSLLDNIDTAPTHIAFQRIPGLDEVD